MRPALARSLPPPAAGHVRVEKAVQTAWWELRRLADRAQPAVRRAFMAAVADVRSVTTLARLEEMVRTGDLAGLQRVLAGEPLEAALRARLAPAVVRLAQDAGQKAVGALPASLRGVARFDLLNPKTVDFLRSYSFGLIRQIGATTREGIRRVVTDAFERGGHPREQARQIRNMVGLTARQAAAVSGYRAQLLAQGVRRSLADRRAQRYADRLLRRRALNIARTETIRAANVGQQALWDQMADEGLIEKDRARKVWIVTPDDRLCEICAAIPGMNPGGVPAQGGEFATDVGPVPYPPAHPQCRCAVGLEFRDAPAPPQPPTRPPRRPRVRRVRPPAPPRRTTPAEQRRRAQLTPQSEEAVRGLPPVPVVPPSFDEAFEVAKDWLKKADEFARRTYNVGVVDTTEFLKVVMGGRAKTRDIYESAKRSLDPALDRARKNAKAAARRAGVSYSDDYSYAQRIYAEKMVARAARTGYQSGLQQTLETVEEALKELERLKDTFPMAGAELVVFPFAQGVRSLGYIYRYSATGADTRVIFLNGRLARKKSIATEGAALVRRTRRTGDAPWNAVAHEETSAAAMTLRHEFAHALDPMIQGPARKTWLYGSVQEATEIGMEFRAIIEQEAKKAGMTATRWFRKDEEVSKHISQYGAKKGWSEMWPETIAMVAGPGYVKGTLPPAVEEFVMKIVRKVKAKGGLGTAD